jgi:hypothetical protein
MDTEVKEVHFRVWKNECPPVTHLLMVPPTSIRFLILDTHTTYAPVRRLVCQWQTLGMATTGSRLATTGTKGLVLFCGHIRRFRSSLLTTPHLCNTLKLQRSHNPQHNLSCSPDLFRPTNTTSSRSPLAPRVSVTSPEQHYISKGFCPPPAADLLPQPSLPSTDATESNSIHHCSQEGSSLTTDRLHFQPTSPDHIDGGHADVRPAAAP